jgi:hypothetical protein
MFCLVVGFTCCVNPQSQVEQVVVEATHTPKPPPKKEGSGDEKAAGTLVTGDYFSLTVPRSLRENATQGEDSELWEFSNENITVNIESGPFAMTLEDNLRVYPEYREEWKMIGEEKVKIISFTYGEQSHTLRDPSKKNVVAGFFPKSGNVKSNLTLWISFRSVSERQAAIDIIESVRFK